MCVFFVVGCIPFLFVRGLGGLLRIFVLTGSIGIRPRLRFEFERMGKEDGVW